MFCCTTFFQTKIESICHSISNRKGCCFSCIIAIGQKFSLAENSEIHIFAIFSVFKGHIFEEKKGRHWLGPGFKIGINEKFGKFMET